jgi:hypothetical protein
MILARSTSNETLAASGNLATMKEGTFTVWFPKVFFQTHLEGIILAIFVHSVVGLTIAEFLELNAQSGKT